MRLDEIMELLERDGIDTEDVVEVRFYPDFWRVFLQARKGPGSPVKVGDSALIDVQTRGYEGE